MIEILEYHSPSRLSAALKILSRTRGMHVLAGGTDEVVRLKEEKRPVRILDISRIAELGKVRETRKEIVIGALVTHRMIEEDSCLAKFLPSLVRAASMIGSPQIRSRGTIGGNLVNASPAGDLIPPLVTCGARVVMVSGRKKRELLLERFLKGPGKTALAAGELLHSVVINKDKIFPFQSFMKAGQRNSLAISLAGVAVALKITGGIVKDARIALGSVAPTVIRAGKAELILVGCSLDGRLAARASAAAARESSPIDDLRGQAWYRRKLVSVLLEDALADAVLPMRSPGSDLTGGRLPR